MESTGSPHPLAQSGFRLAPIYAGTGDVPLRICVLLRSEPDPASGAYLLLREMPGAQVYLGAVCDASERILEWVEVWVQSLELRELVFSGYHERLTNSVLDARWRAEHQLAVAQAPETVIVTGAELANPRPVLIKRRAASPQAVLVPTEASCWELCKDDALLDSAGLEPYSASPFRYLHEPGDAAAKTFLATSPDAPANAHVQTLDRLKTAPEVTEVFNPQAGLLRVTRFSPLGLEDYLQVLEGRPWQALGPAGRRWFGQGVYGQLEIWSANPKGMPFLLHGAGAPAERLNEIFFLKLSGLLGVFQEVRAYVKAQQLPLLNLSPTSFGVHLSEVGEHFPALWAARCRLVKPGQAHPLNIKSTEQRYFIRLGKIAPSPFLPEGLGAHSFGIGSIRRRNVLTQDHGTVLEGTLVAEEYLVVDPNDLLWFKLPLGEQSLECYAHVYAAEAVGPREARFRTVPSRLPEEVIGTLTSATTFAKAPYEIWPLLSSPSDLHSLAILSVRALLANSRTNLPAVVDDVQGLARFLGKEPVPGPELPAKLRAALERDSKLLDLISPQALVEREWTPPQARAEIQLDLWLDAIAWLLRLFPGAGSHSYCKNFGDVSPLALENVFDGPIEELENLTLRARSLLTSTSLANQEVAAAILGQLERG